MAAPPRKPGEIDVETVRELIEAMAEHEGTELEWDHHGKDRLRIRRGTPAEAIPAAPVRTAEPKPVAAPQTTAPPPAEAATPEPEEKPAEKPVAPPPAEVDSAATEEVTSPMVGTFYLRPKPDAAAFVETGDIVETGQTFCIVEAMKLMNEIQAEKKCRVVDILVKDGESVEYGQPLLLIEPL